MDIFNSAPRRKPSHAHRHYESHILHDGLLNNIYRNRWMCITRARNIFTTLFKSTLLVQLMFGKPCIPSIVSLRSTGRAR
jgi:hypothetical protein